MVQRYYLIDEVDGGVILDKCYAYDYEEAKHTFAVEGWVIGVIKSEEDLNTVLYSFSSDETPYSDIMSDEQAEAAIEQMDRIEQARHYSCN